MKLFIALVTSGLLLLVMVSPSMADKNLFPPGLYPKGRPALTWGTATRVYFNRNTAPAFGVLQFRRRVIPYLDSQGVRLVPLVGARDCLSPHSRLFNLSLGSGTSITRSS